MHHAPIRKNHGTISALALLTCCGLPACAHRGQHATTPLKTVLAPASDESRSTNDPPRLSTWTINDAPALSAVAREGNLVPALSVVALTPPGPVAPVVLASIVQGRLQSQAQLVVTTRIHRGSYELRLLIQPGMSPNDLIRVLRRALTAPLTNNEPGIQLAEQRLHLLKRSAVGPKMLPYLECTRELQAVPSELPPKPSDALQTEKLNGWIRSSHTSTTLSVGVVGPAQFCQGVKTALETQGAWPAAVVPSAPTGTPSSQEVISVVEQTAQLHPNPRLLLAVHFGSATLGHNVLDSQSATATLPNFLNSYGRWTVSKISNTTSPHGSCISVALERRDDSSVDTQTQLQEAADLVALWKHEVTTRTSSSAMNSTTNVVRRILAARDVRDTAAAAAWWALANDVPQPSPRWITLLQTAPQSPEKKPSRSSIGAETTLLATRLQTTIEEAQRSWETSPLQVHVATEPGQDRFWMLVASPCDLIESSDNAGLSALAATAAATESNDNITLSPWISYDGVGLVASGIPALNESPRHLAVRIADRVGLALSTHSFSPHRVRQARETLFRWIAQNDIWGGPVAEQVATLLIPGSPSALLPWGTRSALMEISSDEVAVRWNSAMSGPLRVAVIANTDNEQGQASVRELDRWISHRRSRLNQCPHTSTTRSDRFNHSSATPSAAATVEGAAPRVVVTLAAPSTCSTSQLRVIAEALRQVSTSWKTFETSPSVPLRLATRLVGPPRFPAFVLSAFGINVDGQRLRQELTRTLDSWKRRGLPAELFTSARDAANHAAWEQRSDPLHRLESVWRNTRFDTPSAQTRDSVQACLNNLPTPPHLVTLRVNQPRQRPAVVPRSSTTSKNTSSRKPPK